jgi:hypothetical protein
MVSSIDGRIDGAALRAVVKVLAYEDVGIRGRNHTPTHATF